LNASATAPRRFQMRWFLTLVIGLAAGFAGAAAWDLSGLGARSTRDYLLAHPEVLPEAMDVLQQREQLARIEPLRRELERPFPGAVLGNPDGAVTLVEFTDYACGFCRQSVPDVDALIAANPDLRVVIREYPILSPDSVDAARMALAAAQQGRYAQFHAAMFRLSPPSAATIEAAAEQAGVDLAEARAAIATGAFDAQLQSNHQLAEALGITGTPGWVIGDRSINGAAGREAIGEAIEEARPS
jgi:protein-disulfide isomerase